MAKVRKAKVVDDKDFGPMDVYKAAWKRADAEGRSLSSLAREALERYLDS